MILVGRTDVNKMSSDISNKINTLFSQNEWKKARSLLIKELKKEPDHHWLLTRLSTTYYEEFNYKKALELSEQALEIEPMCPLVLWDYAGALDMLGRHKDAIKMWKRLLKLGVDKIANDKCGEGRRWALALINDCRYRIGLSYKKSNNISSAIDFIKEHIANRAPGIPSIYNLSLIRKTLKKLIRSKDK